MNYRHLYHAGNFADVLKHVVLVAMLQSLQKKETPFCFMDTHAGIGLYALQSEQAQKIQEYERGIIALLLKHTEKMPALLQDYLTIVRDYYADNILISYPGSPVIAEKLLRPQDQMLLSELHNADYQTLKSHFYHKDNIAVHHMDAYLAMKAFLPPKLKRGFVLIDPPFETGDDFFNMHQALKRALTHWRSGHFMMWYPIKNQDAVDAFYDTIESLNTPHMILELSLQKAEVGKLSSCGVLLINPPWQIEETLTQSLPFLAEALNARWRYYVSTP